MEKKTKKITKPQNILITVLAALVVLIAYDLSPYGGVMALAKKYIECGRRPVESGVVFGGGVKYYIDAWSEPGLGYHTYFCTPLEAEKAGYSANKTEYVFPHLTTEERRAVMEKYQQ
ncbi:MAG: hypothetical protein WAW62_03400 [Candidatus Saccharimonas aalborgensis]